jgi:hypothetical protein
MYDPAEIKSIEITTKFEGLPLRQLLTLANLRDCSIEEIIDQAFHSYARICLARHQIEQTLR